MFMKNFKDKIHFSGTLEQASKLSKILEELPDGTFGAIEIEVGSKKYLTAKIKDNASGSIENINLIYHKDEKGIRNLKTPSETSYKESGSERELSFENEGIKYTITLED